MGTAGAKFYPGKDRDGAGGHGEVFKGGPTGMDRTVGSEDLPGGSRRPRLAPSRFSAAKSPGCRQTDPPEHS